MANSSAVKMFAKIYFWWVILVLVVMTISTVAVVAMPKSLIDDAIKQLGGPCPKKN